MNKYPKISIVTACFNHKDFIRETIESVLSQNYPNLEYVVIDDGSTDGSWEIIKKYKDRISYCDRMEGHRDTPTIALNFGIGKTSGEIMGWLNSDDILLPGSLLKVAEIFNQQKDIDWFTGIATTINSCSAIVNANMRFKNRYDYLIGDWPVIQQESTFWRRGLWEKAGGNLNGQKKWAFDTELWTRFFMITTHYHVDCPLGAFRRGQQSKSVSEPDSFFKPCVEFVKEMRQRSPKGVLILAFLYRLSKLFRCVLACLPDRIIIKLPILKNFTYKLIQYSFDKNKWIVRDINPYRRYYV